MGVRRRMLILWPKCLLTVLLLHQIRSKPASAINLDDGADGLHFFPPRGPRNERALDLQKKPFTLPSTYSAANARRRCQYNNGTLWPSATMCEDELGAEACDSIFAQGQPRSLLCHNPAMSDLVRRCARTCKVCCELEKFDCKDSAAGLIDCSKHKEKCYDPAWYKVMMSTCEHTCGFCGAERCFDAADGCWSLRALCNQPQFSDIMRHQCTKTCGKCSSKAGGIVSISPSGVVQQISSGEQPPQQPFVIASTARPFVFTPPTPPVVTTPRPTKEIVVVVRPNPKKCFDKSVTCSLHKSLCDSPRYAELLADRCAKTCNFCDRSVPLVEVQESGKSGEDRPAVREGPFTRPPHADHGYYRRHRNSIRRRETMGLGGTEVGPKFTFSGEPIEEEASDTGEIDGSSNESTSESAGDEEHATTNRPTNFRKRRSSGREGERKESHSTRRKTADRYGPSITQIILNVSGSELAGSGRSSGGSHSQRGSRLERLLEVLKTGRRHASSEVPGIEVRRLKDVSGKRQRNRPGYVIFPVRDDPITAIVSPPVRGGHVYADSPEPTQREIGPVEDGPPIRNAPVPSSPESGSVDYAKLKLVVPAKTRTQEPKESFHSDEFPDLQARPLPAPSRVQVDNDNDDDESRNGGPGPSSSIDEGDLERLIEDLGRMERAKARGKAREVAAKTIRPESSQLGTGSEQAKSPSAGEKRDDSGGEREESEASSSDFSRPDEEFDGEDSEGSALVTSSSRIVAKHGSPGRPAFATRVQRGELRRSHRRRHEQELKRQHRRRQQQKQRRRRRLRRLRKEQKTRGRVVRKIHKGVRKFIEELRDGDGNDGDGGFVGLRRKKREVTALLGNQYWSALGYAPQEEEVQPIEEERVSERIPLYQRRMIAEYPEQLLSNGTTQLYYVGMPEIALASQADALTNSEFQPLEADDRNSTQSSADSGALTTLQQTGQTFGSDTQPAPNDFESSPQPTDDGIQLSATHDNVTPEGDDLTKLIEAVQGQQPSADMGEEPVRVETLPPIYQPPPLLLDPIPPPTITNAANDQQDVDFGWDIEAEPYRGRRPIPVSNRELAMLKSIEEEAHRLNIPFKKFQLPKPAVLPPDRTEKSTEATPSGSGEGGEEGDDDSERTEEVALHESREETKGEDRNEGGLNLIDLISRKFTNAEGVGKKPEQHHHSLSTRADSPEGAIDQQLTEKNPHNGDDLMDPLEAYFQQFPLPKLTEDSPPEEKLLVEGLAGKPVTEPELTAPTRSFEPAEGKYEAGKAPRIKDDHWKRPLEWAKSPRRPSALPSNGPTANADRSNVPSKSLKRHHFDGVLRDRQGRRFDKSQLDIHNAIEKIKDVYDVSSSSDASDGEYAVEEDDPSSSGTRSDLSDYSDEESTYEYPHRARHRPRHREATKKGRGRRPQRRRSRPRPRHETRYDDSYGDSSSSDSDSDGASESGEAAILSKERRITRELKTILRGLISLKRSHYRGRGDEAHADLKRFLVERRDRRRKLALLKRLSGDDDESELGSVEAALGDETLGRRRGAVILIDANRGGGGRRYDPLTGGFIYDSPQEYAAGPVDPAASDRYRAGIFGAGYGDAVQAPVRYATGPTVRLVAAQGAITTQPRIIGTAGSPTSNTLLQGYVPNAAGAGGGTTVVYGSQQPAMSLQNSGGFTHVDVGVGFGPIPPELCKDYYPYCQQITPNGFCTSAFYPLKMKREFCPHSCNLC